MNPINSFWKNTIKYFPKRKISTIALISLAGVLLYFPILFHYFQADEWYFFGKVISSGNCGVWCLIKPSGFHFIPLSSILVYLFFKFFGTNPFPYAIFSYAVHIINSVLVYHVVKKCINRHAAGIAALFFLTFAQANQSVTWFAASFAVLPATFFLLVSIFHYLRSLEGKNPSLIYAYVSLVISLFFKEDAIGVFPIYFLYDFFRKRNAGRLMSGAAITAVYLLIRFIVAKSLHAEQVGVSTVGFSVQQIIRNMMVMPLSLLSSLVFREQDILFLGRIVGNFVTMIFAIPSSVIRNHDIFNENITYTYLAPVLGFITAIFLSRTLRLTLKMICVGLAIIVLLSVPYIFLPQGFRLESRHYYIFSIALSGIIAYAYSATRSKSTIPYYFMAFLTGILLVRNIIAVGNNLTYSLRLSETMKSYISSLHYAQRYVSDKMILVNTGDLPPLYSGVGYVAMILYEGNTTYADFFSRDELWNWGSEGYFEHGKTGFGFYLTEKSYLEAKGNPPDAQAVSIHWNNKTMEAKVRPYPVK